MIGTHKVSRLEVWASKLFCKVSILGEMLNANHEHF